MISWGHVVWAAANEAAPTSSTSNAAASAARRRPTFISSSNESIPCGRESAALPWTHLTGRFSSTAKPLAFSSCFALSVATPEIHTSRAVAAWTGAVITGTVSAFHVM